MSKEDFSSTALNALNKNKQAARSIIQGDIDINKEKKDNDKRANTKSVQRGFLMPQTLIEDLTDLSKLYGVTFTQFVNTNLERIVESQRDKLEAYRKLREEINNENI